MTGGPAVLRIGAQAFEGCRNLRDAPIRDGVIRTIEYQAFQGCGALTNVFIPDTVATLGTWVFSDCTGLVSAVIGPGDQGLPAGFFFGCSRLETVILPSNLTSIGYGTFYGCTNLAGVSLPESLTTIDSYAFDTCSRLSRVDIPSSVTSLGDYVFHYCTGLTNMVVPAGLSRIGEGAFYWCERLAAVTIPSSVGSIGRAAFLHCTNLTVIVLPPGLTAIEPDTFSECHALTRLTIPEGVTNLGYSAFRFCVALTNVTFHGDAPVAGTDIFDNADEVTVYYLSGTAGWGETYEGRPARMLPPVPVMAESVPVSVPEGGSATFRVRLAAPPLADTHIMSGRTSGDADIYVSAGGWLAFSSTNWSSYQTVTVSAAEDDGDNADGSAVVTCGGIGLSNVAVEVTEEDDDIYTLTVTSLYGTVCREPDRLHYESGSLVALTAVPGSAYWFREWTGDVSGTTNPAIIVMDGNRSVEALYGPVAPGILPPAAIRKKGFTARWEWVEGGAPEGELNVASNPLMTVAVPGYEAMPVGNGASCVVTNLSSGRSYWYRVRRVLPDGAVSGWSPPMKVRTGKGAPVFRLLLSGGPVSKGVIQLVAVTNLVSGSGVLSVRSSNTNAVRVASSAGVVSLSYAWKGSTAARVTFTLTHPETGNKASYAVDLSRPVGEVAVVERSALTNAGTRVAQSVVMENRTAAMLYGIRLRISGLDDPDWLINRTGIDPATRDPVCEFPCLFPVGGRLSVWLVYNAAYRKQAKTHPATYGAWAVMTPLDGGEPLSGDEMAITRCDLYDGLTLLGLPANRSRLYRVLQSDDNGVTWATREAAIRATSNFLMWLDLDVGAPSNRLYRVVDAGL